MADHTGIEWTDSTWNPVVGCAIVSRGCTNCYAMRTAGARTKHTAKYQGLTQPSKAGPVWTGEVRFWEKALTDPLKWKEPRRVFVNSMGDLFAENVPDEWIDRVFAVMALSPQHTFQVLTKRPERMRAYLSGSDRHAEIYATAANRGFDIDIEFAWPLANVWLGVSCEDQATADERIPILLDTPAALRFISAEPLLDAINLKNIAAQFSIARDEVVWLDALSGRRMQRKQFPMFDPRTNAEIAVLNKGPALDWVIVGGESGPHARPMDPRWPLWLRDSCEEAGVPFFFKQWGEFSPEALPGRTLVDKPMRRVGKKAAGRILDGSEWNEFPEVRP